MNPGVSSYRATGYDLVSKHGANDFHGLVYYKHAGSMFDSTPSIDPGRRYFLSREEFGEAGGAIFKDYTFFYGGWMHQQNRYGRTLFANVPTTQMRAGDFTQFLNAATSPAGVAVILRRRRHVAIGRGNASGKIGAEARG